MGRRARATDRSGIARCVAWFQRDQELDCELLGEIAIIEYIYAAS